MNDLIKAMYLMHNKMYLAAIQYFEASIDTQPNPVAPLKIMECMEKLGMYDAIIDNGLQYIDEYPSSYHYYKVVGVAYHELRYHKEAAKLFNHAIKLLIEHYKNPPVTINSSGKETDLDKYIYISYIAWMHVLMGNYDEAIKYTQESQKINTNSYDMHYDFYNLGLIMQGKKKFSEAIEYFNKTLEKNPNHVESCYGIGECHEQTGNSSEAIKWMQKAVEMSPEWGKPSYKLYVLQHGSIPKFKLTFTEPSEFRCILCNAAQSYTQAAMVDAQIIEKFGALHVLKSDTKLNRPPFVHPFNPNNYFNRIKMPNKARYEILMHITPNDVDASDPDLKPIQNLCRDCFKTYKRTKSEK